MEKALKIIEKFKNSRHGHTFEDCRKVLEYLGFKIVSACGSHYKFEKEGLVRPFILAKHFPISPAAVQSILNYIEKAEK